MQSPPANTVTVITIGSPSTTNIQPTVLATSGTSNTPQVKRTYSARTTSTTSSEGSQLDHLYKRGRLDLSLSDDTYIDPSTPETLLRMGEESSESEETIEVKVSVLQNILHTLGTLQRQVHNVEKSQQKLRIDLLCQDIKSDKILTNVGNLKEDFKANQILSKVVNLHTAPTQQIPPPDLPQTNLPPPSLPHDTATGNPADLTTHIPMWKSKFHKRRMAYKQHFYNVAKAKILKNHVEANPSYIVQKHRPKYALNNEDYADRLVVSKASQIQESKSLMNSANTHSATINRIDRDIGEAINKAPINPRQKLELRQQWEKEVGLSKSKSENLVSGSITYMKELPKSTPFRGFTELEKIPNGAYQVPRGRQSDAPTHKRQEYRGNWRDTRGNNKHYNPNYVRSGNRGRSDNQRQWRETGFRVFNNSNTQLGSDTPHFRHRTQ